MPNAAIVVPADAPNFAQHLATDINNAFNRLSTGGGGITGPATSTNNNVPQWDGTDGSTLKDGLAVGTSANNLVQLTAASKYPAVDGSLITNTLHQVVTQTFTSSGTYTPTAGMQYCIIECVGGGAGGGGVSGSAASVYIAGGGGAGGYSRKLSTAVAIGASQTVTIGAAGAGGTAGSNNGSAGGDTTVGTVCIGKGGSGGNFGSSIQIAVGGAGGVAGTGDVVAVGGPGQGGFYNSANATIIAVNGAGGNSVYGGGGKAASFAVNTATAGTTGQNYGGGGGGANATDTVGTAAGGDGKSGVVIITEFV